MIYIHIPYCGSFCTYCGFYSETATGAGCGINDYVEALCTEIAGRRAELSEPHERDTLYIGGGTPSVLPLSALKRIVSALREAGAGADYEEFTVEVNPEDILEKGQGYAEGLLEAGVNRISMGVQSLDDRILGWMNRRHDADGAAKAYRILRDAGFRNISIDLIFGISMLEDKVWSRTLDGVLDGLGTGTPPEHISAYQLSVEPDSALASMRDRGLYEEASDSLCEGQYAELCSRLASAGYRHYEISNFSLPGYEARHNSGYWYHIPYTGLGPGAHSLDIGSCHPEAPSAGQGGRNVFRRSWNIADVRAYCAAAHDGDFSPVRESETLSARQVDIERIMLALRTDEGIEESFLRKTCAKNALDAAIAAGTLVETHLSWHGRWLMGNGQVKSCPRLRIPEKYFFVSDNIISDIV